MELRLHSQAPRSFAVKMKLKLLIISVFMACLPLLSAAHGNEDHTLTGQVYEQGSDADLTGVRVEVVGTDIVIYTDAEGRFSIPGLSGTSVQVQFSFISFESLETTICLDSPECDDLRIDLKAL